MANPTLPSKTNRYDRDGVYTVVEGVIVNDNVVISSRQSNVPSYDITWTANEPTAGDTATIADGDSPTVAETGQAIADLTAKVNALIAALEAHGLLADS
jgi:hypothetical protein